MDSLIHKINLDCLRKDSQAIVNAKIGEASGRKIVFTLYEGRAPFFVPSDTTVVFRAKKPSGAVLYNNCVVDDGKIEYTITSQTVAEKGVFPCEIQIIGADNKVIYTPCITLNVTENLYSDTEVESSNEFTELENALNKIPSLEVIYSKQDKLIAGENITIAEDGKTISAKGVGVLEVTLTTQNGVDVADKTFEQVKSAVDSGIPVLKVHSDGALLWFFLLDKSPTEIDFVGLVDEQTIAYLTAKQDNTWETTVAARVTAEMLSSLNDKIGNLGQLTTEAKNNLVAAINEAAQSGGSGSTVELDTTLSTAGKAADAKAVGDALAGKVDKVTDKGLSTNDYTNAAKAKVDAIPADPKYTDTVYDDTALKERVATIEGKESAWDAKSDFSGSYNDLTDKPTPLIGTTNELTPTQVYNAVSAGIPVKVQYIDGTYGLLYFTAFNIAESLNVIASQTIVYYNSVYILYELYGDKSSNAWGTSFTTLAEKTDIPAALPNPNALTFTGAVTGSYDGSNAKTVNIPSAVTDDHINSLIDTKLGVIENGSY